jgi:flagellar protein FlaJ
MKIPIGKIFPIVIALAVTITGVLVIQGVNQLMAYSAQSLELSIIYGAVIGGIIVIDTLTALSVANILDLRDAVLLINKHTTRNPRKRAEKLPGSNVLSKQIMKGIENDIFRGKSAQDPVTISKEYSSYTVISALILVPLGIILGVFVNITLAAVATIPVILYFTPKLQAQGNITKRKNEIVDEIGFATTYFAVMQNAGQPLNTSMEKLIDTGIFPGIENEARLLKTNIDRFGMNPVDALDELARDHPNDMFKNFVTGYTAILRTGGQLEVYLRDRMQEYFGVLETRFSRYTQSVGTIGEGLVIVFMLFPLVLVVGSILATPVLVALFMYLGIAVIPIIGIAGVGLIKKAQPSSPDIYEGDLKRAIVAAAIGAVAASITLTPWIMLGVPLALFFGVYGYQVSKQITEVEAINSALPKFLREVTEKKKIGYDIHKAILGVAAESKFNHPFTVILDYMTGQIKLGKQLFEIEVPIRSWAGRATFFILGQISMSGGGAAEDLEPLYSFINSYNTARHEAKINVKLYKFLGYITPLVIPILAVLIINVVGGLNSVTAPTAAAITNSSGNPITITVAKSVLLLGIGMVTVLTSASLGLTMATASDFTSKNTFQTALLILMSIMVMVAITVLPMSVAL